MLDILVILTMLGLTLFSLVSVAFWRRGEEGYCDEGDFCDVGFEDGIPTLKSLLFQSVSLSLSAVVSSTRVREGNHQYELVKLWDWRCRLH
jgi:hypothetical protein